jgi:N-acetylglucosamine-6-phosphate deacetylase
MPGTSFYNASVMLPDQLTANSSVVVSNGKIETVNSRIAFGAGESFDCTGLTLMPGFIDAHIHGADGVDVNTADVAGLIRVARFLARNGVTAWMPTLVPDSDENYRRSISAIDMLMDIQENESIAQAVGVHYEGVFANEKMCGALRPVYFKKFPANQLGELPKLDRGVHLMTFAPEVEGGIGLAKELKRQGWVASIGHTSADVDTLNEALAAGAHHVTHFFNAMTPMHHRDIGVVGWALARPEVTFDIIADGIHVHPAMLKFACRTKTPARVSLISDSVAPTGLGDGEFQIWGEKIRVEKGRTQNDRGRIAGSVITMLDAVKRMRSIGFTDTEVAHMASFNPARLLKLDSTYGSIEVGKRADLVGIDEDGIVRLTVIAGRVVLDGR